VKHQVGFQAFNQHRTGQRGRSLDIRKEISGDVRHGIYIATLKRGDLPVPVTDDTVILVSSTSVVCIVISGPSAASSSLPSDVASAMMPLRFR
jgi:hypothetical protein